MDPATQTLFRFLTARNPALDNSSCKSGPNSQSQGAPDLFPAEIKKWKEFEYEKLIVTFKEDLGPVLRRKFILSHPRDPESDECEICNEPTFSALLQYWTYRIIKDALKVSQQELGNTWSSDRITIAIGGRAKSTQGCKPDLGAVKLKGVKVTGGHNILPGEIKLSKKWRSAAINDGRVKFDDIAGSYNMEQHWRPLKQIFRYCVFLGTQYGYIITDDELVVMKISKSTKYEGEGEGLSQEAADSQESYGSNSEDPKYAISKDGCIEYKAIPWISNCQGKRNRKPKLTIHLALWFLHLMAVKESDLPPIDAPLVENKRVSSQVPSSQGKKALQTSQANVSFSSVTSKMGKLLENEDDDDTDDLWDDPLTSSISQPVSYSKKRNLDMNNETYDSPNKKR